MGRTRAPPLAGLWAAQMGPTARPWAGWMAVLWADMKGATWVRCWAAQLAASRVAEKAAYWVASSAGASAGLRAGEMAGATADTRVVGLAVPWAEAMAVSWAV